MPIHPGQDKTVERLLEGVHRGEFVKPSFQRKFKWQPNQVVDLLASVAFNYFSGLLLFWEIDNDAEQRITFEHLEGAKKSDHVNFAILDGQQRLSSLYYAIYKPDHMFPNTSSYYVFYLDIEARYHNELENSISYYRPKRQPTSIKNLKSVKDKYIEELKFPLALLSDENFKKEELEDWKYKYALKWYDKCHTVNNKDNEQKTQWIVDRMQDIGKYISTILNYKFTTHVLGKENSMEDVSIMFALLNEVVIIIMPHIFEAQF